jgi:hypothetical protein
VDGGDGRRSQLRRAGDNKRAGKWGDHSRATLARMGVRWPRAKHWITSPDPLYARKKGGARPADGLGGESSGVGGGLLGGVLVEQGIPAELARLQRSPRATASGGAASRRRRARPEGHLLPRALYMPDLLERMWLRFVDGRAVGGISTRLLSWCCRKLEGLGKKIWVLIWDKASWHIKAGRSSAGSVRTTERSKTAALA